MGGARRAQQGGRRRQRTRALAHRRGWRALGHGHRPRRSAAASTTSGTGAGGVAVGPRLAVRPARKRPTYCAGGGRCRPRSVLEQRQHQTVALALPATSYHAGRQRGGAAPGQPAPAPAMPATRRSAPANPTSAQARVVAAIHGAHSGKVRDHRCSRRHESQQARCACSAERSAADRGPRWPAPPALPDTRCQTRPCPARIVTPSPARSAARRRLPIAAAAPVCPDAPAPHRVKRWRRWRRSRRRCIRGRNAGPGPRRPPGKLVESQPTTRRRRLARPGPGERRRCWAARRPVRRPPRQLGALAGAAARPARSAGRCAWRSERRCTGRERSATLIF